MQSQTVSIKNWPLADRPREKLLQHGEQSLTDAELLAILLSTGMKGQSAVDVAMTIVKKFKTFRNMSESPVSFWESIPGLGRAKFAQIKAALEIGRRFRENETRMENRLIRSSGDAAAILIPILRDRKIEIFKTIYLDAKQRMIEITDTTAGTTNRAVPFIREIFHRGINNGAVSLICGHNHPSGEVTPSPEDRKFTDELVSAGRIMQIKVLDHLIIGENKYYSFADDGTV